jgi:UDP-N-acetylmuramoylalanine--D-glutamate ligase
MKQNVVILGLGETGFSCVEYFTHRNIPVTVMDSRENPPKLLETKKHYPEIEIHTGGFVPDILAKTDLLVLSPGIASDDPSIQQHLKNSAEIVGDIELFAQELNKLKVPLVAITGSNGKSTVTTLVGEMAKKAGIKVAVGGNLGIPSLTLLKEPMELCVLELSSFQLETTESLHPTVSTILNISPDHMDRYSSVEEYYAAKARIYRKSQKIVVNLDDDFVWNQKPKEIPSIYFSVNSVNSVNEQDGISEDNKEENKEDNSKSDYLNNHHLEGIYKLENNYLVRGKTPLLALKELKLFGRHNIANALAVLALAEAVNIPLEPCIDVLKTFTGLKHRCEWIRTRNEVPWINDSKGTNVGATQAALEGLASDISGKWVLIAGGIGKNADFSVLKPLVLKHCRAVVLIGEASDELEKLFSEGLTCARATSMKDAVSIASKLAKPGDGVLLSPACASFDMFKNFEDRGDVFRKEVLDLQ